MEKILFIGSKNDEASFTLFNYFKNNRNENFEFFEMDQRPIFFDFPEKKIDRKFDNIVLLSRHSSEAKINSITVHPVGNFSAADLGGVPGELAPSNPSLQTSVLRNIINNYKGNRYEITFEATHHGPRSHVPLVFAEIGTGPENWNDPEALEALLSGFKNTIKKNTENFIGAGGGHYATKFTKYIMENENASIGHIISKFRLQEISHDKIIQAFNKTEKCKGILVDKKGTNSEGFKKIALAADIVGTEVIKI
ncbi:D-aminoacyl-tRNA deacylase [Caldiplasma sukawensis]